MGHSLSSGRTPALCDTERGEAGVDRAMAPKERVRVLEGQFLAIESRIRIRLSVAARERDKRLALERAAAKALTDVGLRSDGWSNVPDEASGLVRHVGS